MYRSYTVWDTVHVSSMIRRLIGNLLALILGLAPRPSAKQGTDDALDDDVLDAWLDEDEIDASGL